MNLLNLIEDQTTGYDNLRALMRAVDTSSKAVLNLGGETVTLEYPEARFMMGKYKAYNKAGRQEEFLRDLGDPVQFDLHMKQLRDLIQKQKQFRGSIPGERTMDEQYSAETKKKESDSIGLTSTSARTDRMLTQLRVKNPQAKNDLEALIYDADKQRRRQDRDEIELARLDFENDREEADIDRIEKDLQRIKKQRNITEQVMITTGEFKDRQATLIEHKKNFVTVDIEGFGRHVIHESRVAETQIDINRINTDRPILPSGAAKLKYAADHNMYDDAHIQESLRPGEYHVATVTLDNGEVKKFKVTFDEGYTDAIKNFYAKQGRTVKNIDMDWSVHGPMNEKQDACYHKVRSRYKVWPSAYASGALVQCRKKGAANWGEGGKKKK